MGGNNQQIEDGLSVIDKLKQGETALRAMLNHVTSIPVKTELNVQEKFLYHAPALIEQADDVAPLVNGPLNKTKSTKRFEALVKHILTGRKVTVEYENDQIYLHVKIGKKTHTYHLNEVMKNAYLQHVEFSTRVQKQYLKYRKQEAKKFYQNLSRFQVPYQEYLNAIPEAYQLALQIYTGNSYKRINEFLRADYAFLNRNDTQIIDCIVDVGMAMAGLNQTNEHPDLPHQVFRIENTFTDAAKEKRMKLIEDHDLDYTRKFISTSIATNGLSSCQGVYLNPRGKYITGLSVFPRENELLMPPTQLRWLTHRDKKYFVAQVVETPVGIPEQECYVPPSKGNAVPSFAKKESAPKRIKCSTADCVSPLNPLGEMNEVIDHLNKNYYLKPYSTLYNATSDIKHETLDREKYGLVHVLRSAYLVPFVAKALYPEKDLTLNEIRCMQLALLFSEVARGTDGAINDCIKVFEKSFYIASAHEFERYIKLNPIDGIEPNKVKLLIVSMGKYNQSDNEENIYERITRMSKNMAKTTASKKDSYLSALECFAVQLRDVTGDNPTGRSFEDKDIFAQCSGLDIPEYESHGTYCMGRLQQVKVPESLNWKIASEHPIHPIADTVEWVGKKLGFC